MVFFTASNAEKRGSEENSGKYNFLKLKSFVFVGKLAILSTPNIRILVYTNGMLANGFSYSNDYFVTKLDRGLDIREYST